MRMMPLIYRRRYKRHLARDGRRRSGFAVQRPDGLAGEDLFLRLAKLAPPLIERLERADQLAAVKIGPVNRGAVILGVSSLPDQEVAQAHLAGRADHQVGVGLVLGVQVAPEDLFRDLLRRQAVG